MKLNYNVSGADRKRLVKVIGETLGITPRYMGTPSFAFQIGGYEVSKHGVLSFEGNEHTASVLAAVEAAGFVAEKPDMEVSAESTEPQEWETIEEVQQETGTDVSEPQATADNGMEPIADDKPVEAEVAPMEDITNLSISMPREIFTAGALDNLDALLDSKGELIKEAFGIESIEYTLAEERITFAWFHGGLTPEVFRAYSDFIGKLCEMARRQKRVVAKAKKVDNHKYAFRCFLLRLGLIGDEYKTSRKILLQNLSGNAAFKSAHRKGGVGQD